MKRRDLLSALSAAGFVLVRSNGPHDTYGNGLVLVSVPRHNEIKEGTARRILKDAGLK